MVVAVESRESEEYPPPASILSFFNSSLFLFFSPIFSSGASIQPEHFPDFPDFPKMENLGDASRCPEMRMMSVQPTPIDVPDYPQSN